MEHTTEVAGVIFNHTEVETIAEAIGAYLASPNLIYSSRALETYREIQPLLKPKHGRCAALFIPADVVIEVGMEIKRDAAASMPRGNNLAHLGYIGTYNTLPTVPISPSATIETRNAAFAKKMMRLAQRSQQCAGDICR